LEFEDERLVAVTGADFDLSLDGRPAPLRAPFTVSAGSRLRFGARRLGARAYLAVSGGITVTPILGSRATHLVSVMGGFNGRALIAGDRLPLGARSRFSRAALPLPPARESKPDAHSRLRVLPGPQLEYFQPDTIDVLQSAPYVVGQDSDRMGFRLEGPRLTHARQVDIISDATPLGVLQVPSSGQPILLMADRQTTGGYPKIATVIAADMAIAGQLAPADTITFAVCTTAEALKALITQERALMALEDRPS
jgi:antagonist of KipI